LPRFDLRSLAWDVGAAILLLGLPLIIFLKYNAYPLAHPEVLLCLALIGLAGLILGVVMSLGRSPGRIVVMVFLAVLVVDIQTDWINALGLRLLLNFIFFSTLFWFLRKRLSPAVVLVAGLMVMGALVSPSGKQVRINGPSPAEATGNSELPFILHIILDEHIGIEGIPRRFDPNGEIAGEVSNAFMDKGFRVFGRAYSDYFNTELTISNMLNFTVSPNAEEYLPVKVGRNQLLGRNAWFDLLCDQGYRIHVFQPEYIKFDRHGDQGGGRRSESSLTYANESIHALAPANMSVTDKFRYITGSYLRLSYFLKRMQAGYGDLSRSAVGQGLGVPEWGKYEKYLNALSSMNAIELLEKDLEHAGPGKVFFVHLLLPHSPYVYDRNCEIRAMNDGWLTSNERSLDPRRNDEASRAVRYPLYLDQLICANYTLHDILENLSTRPWWDDAIILVHGDHGSRIDTGPPIVTFIDDISDQDFMDAFSTLFVLKRPGLNAGYDRRQLPLGHLFEQLVRFGADPGDLSLEGRPRVLVKDGSGPMVEVDLPYFDHGVPQTGANGSN